jgi:hypothetical protein
MPRLYSNPRDAFPYGQGSVEFAERFGGNKQTMPTEDHTYKNFLLKREKQEPYHWEIKADGGTPPPLMGKWSDVPSMERAVDLWLAQHPDN